MGLQGHYAAKRGEAKRDGQRGNQKSTNWRPPPPPIKNSSYGIKGGGFACHKSRSSYAIKVGSCTTFSVKVRLFQGIFYAIRPLILWHILGSYFLLICQSQKCAINNFWTKNSAGLLGWGSRGSRQIIYVRIFPNIWSVFGTANRPNQNNFRGPPTGLT